MKKILIFILLIAAFAACNQTVYVPVESVKTEYRDNYLRDSITVHGLQEISKDGTTRKNRFSEDFQRADASFDSIYRGRIKALRKAADEAANIASGRVFKRGTFND
jgi:hypothetical protein